MRLVYKLSIAFIVLLFTSLIIMYSIVIDGGSEVGSKLITYWHEEVGNYEVNINSLTAVVHQSLALTLFLFVIVVAIFRMEWRVAAAFFSLVMVVILGLVPPQNLIKSAIEWDLILFLIGSMTLAGVLRELGVFKYLAVNVVRVSKGNPTILLTLIFILAFTLAALLDEVTSIIYVTMLMFELSKLFNIDVKPLIILSVLATNTGSIALPIGNPIGIYLFFTTNMLISEYVRFSFPLALITLIVFTLLVITLKRDVIVNLSNALNKFSGGIDAFVSSYYIQVGKKELKLIYRGLIILTLFITTIVLSEYLCTYLTLISGSEVDHHALLSFIPYIFLVISLMNVPPEKISELLERSVEWPSILFFIGLFILSYSLTYTGAVFKIAYTLSYIKYPSLLLTSFLLSSALLSSVLDNLSVIVSMTPIAILLNNLGLISKEIFFALLSGGVLGGNYTPIGSTANIIAVSIAEKERVRIGWGEWLRVALIITTAQLIVALLWLYIT